MPSIFALNEPLIKFTPVKTANAAVTLTAAELIEGLLLSVPVAAINVTTPTAAAIVAGLESPKVGTAFDFFIRNTSAGANTITLVGGTGVTIVGTSTTAQNVASQFRAVVTNKTAGSEAISIYKLTNGTA
jgi:hypothetical protein